MWYTALGIGFLTPQLYAQIDMAFYYLSDCKCKAGGQVIIIYEEGGCGWWQLIHGLTVQDG